MSTTVTNQSCKREIEIEIPADVVQRELDSVTQKYQKAARLPGFRRGKVPASIIRQRFGKDLKTEVLESLVPRYFREASDREGLQPVSQPQVAELELKEGQPLKFKATFEVLPEIEVSGYQDVKAEHPDVSVSADEVETALKNLQQQHASYQAVEEDRGLIERDFAQAAVTGTPKEADAKPVQLDEVLIEIGGTNTVAEFTQNLLGAKSGEERTFDVAYAADFADERLAGKTLSYNVKVKAIKRKLTPDLNDDFAREVGPEFKSLDDLRTRIRESIEHEKKHQAEHDTKDKIVEQLVARFDFPVPDSLVDRQIDLRLERGLRALAAQGMRTEDMKRLDFERLRAGQRDTAVREVKAALILDKIAEAEKVEVTGEEIDREIEALAVQARQPVEAVRARLTKEGGIDRIRDRIRNDKTLDTLYRRSA